MPTQIEQLPSEIWFHTFSYFEGHELIRLFSHLNSFIDSLLHSKYLHLHLRIRQGESNERLTEWIWSEINRENIFSLNFVTRKANCLIQFLRWNALSLTHLSTLSVYLKQSSSSYNIPYLIIALGQMPSLNRLRIKYRSRLNSNNDPLELLLSALFSSRFPIRSYAINFEITNYQLKTSTWTTNQFLQHLSIEETSFSNLLLILSFTPQLQSLRTRLRESNNVSYQKVSLPNLRKAHLRVWLLPFHQLEIFKECVPTLEILQLTGYFASSETNYLKEKSLRQLVHDIRCFKVNLSGYKLGGLRKEFLKDHMPNSNEGNCLSYEENGEFIKVFIKLRS